MKLRLLYSLALQAVLFLNVSQALEVKPYIATGVGVGLLDDVAAKSKSDSEEYKWDFDTGYAVDVAVGIALSDLPFRFELEYLHQENDVQNELHSWDGDDFYNLDILTDGEATADAGFFNVYYDFTNDMCPIIVSLSAGFGLCEMELDNQYTDYYVYAVEDELEDGVEVYKYGYKNSDTILMYQVGVGFSYPVTEGLTLGAEYKYMSGEDISLEDAFGDHFDAEVEVSRVMFDLRYAF